MQVVTANSLGDGRVVFQTVLGWSHDIDQSELLDTQPVAELALQRANADAAENRVVEPYLIEVTRAAGHTVPLRLRERIRAEGPTTGNSKSERSPAREEAA